MIHNFVPSFSAAGLDFDTFADEWDLDGWEQEHGKIEDSGLTPFDKVYHHNGNNERHGNLNRRNIGWLLWELHDSIASTPVSTLTVKHGSNIRMVVDDLGLVVVTGEEQPVSDGLEVRFLGELRFELDKNSGSYNSNHERSAGPLPETGLRVISPSQKTIVRIDANESKFNTLGHFGTGAFPE